MTISKEKQVARKKAYEIIRRQLKYNELPLTMENVRRVFALVWHKVSGGDVVKAVYKILEGDEENGFRGLDS